MQVFLIEILTFENTVFICIDVDFSHLLLRHVFLRPPRKVLKLQYAHEVFLYIISFSIKYLIASSLIESLT